MKTAIPAFQDALEAVVRASTPAGIPVDLGYPTDNLESKHVLIPGEVTVDAGAGVSGMAQRDETLRTEVRCWAEEITNDYREVRSSALELANAIDDGLSADPTLGGVVAFARVASIEMQEGLTSDTRQCGITLVVEATATVA